MSKIIKGLRDTSCFQGAYWNSKKILDGKLCLEGLEKFRIEWGLHSIAYNMSKWLWLWNRKKNVTKLIVSLRSFVKDRYIIWLKTIINMNRVSEYNSFYYIVGVNSFRIYNTIFHIKIKDHDCTIFNFK